MGRLVCGGKANQAMFVKLDPGSLHFDIKIGRKFLADAKIGLGASLVVLFPLCVKRFFQISTKLATHVALHSFFNAAGSGMRLFYNSEDSASTRRRTCTCGFPSQLVCTCSNADGAGVCDGLALSIVAPSR